MAADRHQADWSDVRTAADCACRIEGIFASDLREEGVLQVTSAVAVAGGMLAVLRIGPNSPRSSTDAFVLAVARARADAIVTTGRILRAEPLLTHALGGPAPAAVASWRLEVLGKSEPPLSVVLTGLGDVDLHHPLFHQARRVLVCTTPEGARALAARGLPENVTTLAKPRSGVRKLLPELARRWESRTIVVEAGPQTSKALYEEPALVDELLLSVFTGERAHRCEVAGVLIDRAGLAQVFPSPGHEHESIEESGTWRFLRLRRGAHDF